MKYYHSTIKIKLDEMLKSNSLMPGKDSPEDNAYIYEWIMMGMYKKPSPNHIYLWNSFEEASICAKFISSHAKQEYNSKEKIPVIIEFRIPDDSKISNDPDSKGLRYEGPISSSNFVRIIELSDN